MIKFRYVYSDGKEIKTFTYTIEDIENRRFFVSQTMLKCHGFKLISRDRFSGVIPEGLFENDIILDSHNQQHKVYFSDKNGWKTRNINDGRRFRLITAINRGFEIISNTHIEALKDQHDR